MESVLGRYRNLVILVGVLFLQVLGLAVQVKRGGDAEKNTRLIRVCPCCALITDKAFDLHQEQQALAERCPKCGFQFPVRYFRFPRCDRK